MTGYAMNPIRVVVDNVQGFADSLHIERIKLLARLAEIDQQMIVLVELAAAVGIEIGTTEQFRATLSTPQAELRARANDPETVGGLRGRGE